MNLKAFAGILVAGLLFAGQVISAEGAKDIRQDAVKASRTLNTGLTADKILAIQTLASVTNADVLKDLKIVDKLKDMVLSDGYNFVIRRAALSALVEMDGNQIPIPGLMDIINTLLQPASRRNRTPFQLRIIALDMLKEIVESNPVMSTAGANPKMNRAFAILETLWKGRRNMPTSMRAGIMQTLGGFGDDSRARGMLMSGLSDSSPEVVEAALIGLRSALLVTESSSSKLADTLSARFLAAVKDKDSNLSVPLLDCLQIVATNINQAVIRTGRGALAWKPSRNVDNAVQQMLLKGNDAEVVAAVKFMMVMSSRDPKVSESLLKVANPDPSRPLSYETLTTVNSALIDVMLGIAQNPSGRSKYKKNAQAIIKHMIAILQPSIIDKVPAELRRTMVLGLSCIPVDFDRVIPVKSLIALLEIEDNSKSPSKVMIRDIEMALTSLTGVAPFRVTTVKVVEPGKGAAAENTRGIVVQKIVRPDIPRWKKWFEQNRSKLVAGKAPYK